MGYSKEFPDSYVKFCQINGFLKEEAVKTEGTLSKVPYTYTYLENHPTSSPNNSRNPSLYISPLLQGPSGKRSTKEIIAILKEILRGKEKHGALSTWVEAQYLKRTGLELPSKWINKTQGL